MHKDELLSEFEAERAEAARLCADCPVIVECGAAADERDERCTSGQGVTTHADHGANKQPDRKESATKKTRVALGAKLTTNRLSRTAKRTLNDHETVRCSRVPQVFPYLRGVPPVPHPLHRGTRNGGNTYTSKTQVFPELMPSLRFSGSRRGCRTWRGHG
jgi:hypothetical protein